MIWGTVSFQSCFCWFYRASPSLAAKNIINLILVLTVLWCPCVEVFSCVVGRGCLLWLVYSLGKTLLAFALLHSIFQGQFTCYPRYFLTSYFCILGPYNEKAIFLVGVLVLKGLVGLHRTVQLLQHHWLGHRLGLLWYWMFCLGNKQRSFCQFWDCIQVLHFGHFSWPWWLLHFFWGIPAHSGTYNVHLS